MSIAGLRVVLCEGMPTFWYPPRADVWKWRLWRRWCGDPRPVPRRLLWQHNDAILVSPETYALLLRWPRSN